MPSTCRFWLCLCLLKGAFVNTDISRITLLHRFETKIIAWEPDENLRLTDKVEKCLQTRRNLGYIRYSGRCTCCTCCVAPDTTHVMWLLDMCYLIMILIYYIYPKSLYFWLLICCNTSDCQSNMQLIIESWKDCGFALPYFWCNQILSCKVHNSDLNFQHDILISNTGFVYNFVSGQKYLGLSFNI